MTDAVQERLAQNLNEKQRTRDVLLTENVTFNSLLLSTNTLKGLSEHGFEKPSPIQVKSIPLGRCGFDLIAKSKSGTGKTLVFSIIALETLSLDKGPQVLILAPTREIAVQIVDVIKKIGCFYEDLKVEAFIGGLPIEEDIKKVKSCHIVVGAPGRINHLIRDKHLDTQSIKLLVLDEADQLLEVLHNDINDIFDHLPLNKQVLALSATYPDNLATFLGNFMLTPSFLSAENETPILLGLKQFVYILQTPNAAQGMRVKNEGLLNILSKISFTQCLVFSKYQTRAESLCNILQQKDWNVDFISGALPQIKRLQAVNNLKEFKCRILLTTDLTARGIDAANVDLVINYDLPDEPMTYLHRMGRAGRFGSKGVCISFILENETEKLQKIIGLIGGENLSVSILENLGDDNIDLWNLENLQQLYGIISDTQLDKNEVIELKKEFKKKPKNQKGKDKMKKNTRVVREVEITGGGCEVEEEIQQETKKRKTSATPVKEEVADETYTRNKALLATVKLLQLDKDIDDDSACSINNYLQLLKEDGKVETKQEDNQKIKEEGMKKEDKNMGKEEEIIKKDDKNVGDEKPFQEILENIFSIGFDSILNPEEKHWMDHLPRAEREKFEKHLQGKEDSEEEEEDEDDNDEDEEEEWEEEETQEWQEQEEYEDITKRWVPVDSKTIKTKKLKKAKVLFSRDEPETMDCTPYETIPEIQTDDFQKYFKQCSNSLWQNGLSFENVQDFDTWYCKWKNEVKAVREFVQQNIYVNEMARYQQNKEYL